MPSNYSAQSCPWPCHTRLRPRSHKRGRDQTSLSESNMESTEAAVTHSHRRRRQQQLLNGHRARPCWRCTEDRTCVCCHKRMNDIGTRSLRHTWRHTHQPLCWTRNQMTRTTSAGQRSVWTDSELLLLLILMMMMIMLHSRHPLQKQYNKVSCTDSETDDHEWTTVQAQRSKQRHMTPNTASNWLRPVWCTQRRWQLLNYGLLTSSVTLKQLWLLCKWCTSLFMAHWNLRQQLQSVTMCHAHAIDTVQSTSVERQGDMPTHHHSV